MSKYTAELRTIIENDFDINATSILSFKNEVMPTACPAITKTAEFDCFIFNIISSDSYKINREKKYRAFFDKKLGL